MNKIMIYTFGIILLTASFSSVKSVEAKPLDQAMCLDLGATAKTIMQKRQEGVSITKILEVLSSTEQDSITEFLISTTKLAYNSPLYILPSNKQTAITEFENKIVTNCLNLI